MRTLFRIFFRAFSHLPLLLLHGLGSAVGLAVWACSSTYRRRAHENAALAGYGWTTALAASVQSGRMAMELPRLWLGRSAPLIWDNPAKLQAVFDQAKYGHDDDKAAGNEDNKKGRGIIILAPHIGCWEVVGQSIADAGFQRGLQMTVMYRPARKPWLDEIIRTSRQRPSMQTVPADLSGVRQLMRVLKGGQIIGVLPDQVPPSGMGVWSKVFGRPAYTMTMAAKMAQSTGAIALVCWCERLSWGRGYRMFTQVLDLDLATDLDGVVLQINQGVEAAVRALPNQYLWGYARYKQPRQNLPPAHTDSHAGQKP